LGFRHRLCHPEQTEASDLVFFSTMKQMLVAAATAHHDPPWRAPFLDQLAQKLSAKL